MALFVHIADEKFTAAIRRAGLRLPKQSSSQTKPWSRGVFAVPVIANFVLTHQWVREKKKWGIKTAIGVYFRLDDTTPVWCGLYNESPLQLCTAAQATALFANNPQLGFQVIIPQSIPRTAIKDIRHLPQLVGWRHFPGAHEKGIVCGCEYCMKGEFKSRRIRERYEAAR